MNYMRIINDKSDKGPACRFLLTGLLHYFAIEKTRAICYHIVCDQNNENMREWRNWQTR
jgi:hypothetical protein